MPGSQDQHTGGRVWGCRYENIECFLSRSLLDFAPGLPGDEADYIEPFAWIFKQHYLLKGVFTLQCKSINDLLGTGINATGDRNALEDAIEKIDQTVTNDVGSYKADQQYQ